MLWNVQKYNARLERFAIWQGGFTEEELEKITDMKEFLEFSDGKVGTESKEDKVVRRSKIAWMHPDHNCEWLYHRIANIVSQVNRDHFLVDIKGFAPFQYTCYGEDEHYTWHFDADLNWNNNIRKMSMVMALTDVDEYEGGEFEICRQGNLDMIETYKLTKGDIMFFDSMFPHRVKPVTKGSRETLVTWVEGLR